MGSSDIFRIKMSNTYSLVPTTLEGLLVPIIRPATKFIAGLFDAYPKANNNKMIAGLFNAYSLLEIRTYEPSSVVTWYSTPFLLLSTCMDFVWNLYLILSVCHGVKPRIMPLKWHIICISEKLCAKGCCRIQSNRKWYCQGPNLVEPSLYLRRVLLVLQVDDTNTFSSNFYMHGKCLKASITSFSASGWNAPKQIGIMPLKWHIAGGSGASGKVFFWLRWS